MYKVYGVIRCFLNKTLADPQIYCHRLTSKSNGVKSDDLGG